MRNADDAHVDPSPPKSSGARSLHISGRLSCRKMTLKSHAHTSRLDSRMTPLVVMAFRFTCVHGVRERERERERGNWREGGRESKRERDRERGGGGGGEEKEMKERATATTKKLRFILSKSRTNVGHDIIGGSTKEGQRALKLPRERRRAGGRGKKREKERREGKWHKGDGFVRFVFRETGIFVAVRTTRRQPVTRRRRHG